MPDCRRLNRTNQPTNSFTVTFLALIGKEFLFRLPDIPFPSDQFFIGREGGMFHLRLRRTHAVFKAV